MLRCIVFRETKELNTNTSQLIMIIENVTEAKVQFKKDVKKNYLRFSLYAFINFTLIILGAIMFFYVEECCFYDPEENSPKPNKKCLELCGDIRNFNKTYSQNIQNNRTVEALNNMTSTCLERCKPQVLATGKQCKELIS